MATRAYKLTSVAINSGDNKASTRIVRRGQITSISYAVNGLAGASVTGQLSFEISKSSVSAFSQNDTPPGGVLSYMSMATAGGVVSESFGANYLDAGISYPVEVGDTIYMHCLAAGGAIANGTAYIMIHVNES